MMTLIDFLLARIAEDEGTALYAQSRDDLQPEDWGGFWLGHYQHYTRHDPARVLAECEAKRRIVADHVGGHRCDWGDWYPEGRCETKVLRILASVYADHPNFDEAWRP